jgi:AraC family transcriptional regulator
MLSANLVVDSVLPFPASAGVPVRAPRPVSRPRPALGLVETGTWGTRMAKHFNLPAAPAVSVMTRQRAQIAVTRLRSQTALAACTAPLRSEQAFIVQLHLQNTAGVRVWQDGQEIAGVPMQAEGSVTVLDLARKPSLHFSAAFDVLQFYISRAALDEFADDNDARRCETLRGAVPGKADEGLRNLGLCLLPVFDEQARAGQHYVEHLLLASHAYIARNYGGITGTPSLVRGGLAPWQLHRATEMMKANLEGQVALTHVARECKLSVSHFVRAFKQTVGEPPYRWLCQQRIEAAKELLLHSDLPMAEIALKCGFADQACFIRAFRKITDATPGEWRRTRLQ